MNEWRLRDTILVVFMVLVVGIMLLQMVQNDRLYDRVNKAIRLMESGRENGAASMPVPASTTQAAGEWLVPNADPGGTCIVCYTAQPATLNPLTYKDAYADYILNGPSGAGCVYESLLRRDPQSLELVGQLAESWQVSDDHLAFTFKLRPEVRWSDGRPLTADDVVFTYRLMKVPALDCQRTQVYYLDMDKVEALDPRTVRFHWTKKYFKAVEQSGGLPIIPKHLLDPDDLLEKDPDALARKVNSWVFEWNGNPPVGSGPFCLESWDRTANRVTLRRNDRYWGPKAMLERLVFRFITQDVAALQTLKQGGIDLMALSPEQWEKQTGDEAFNRSFLKRKYYRATAGYSYIGWNNRRAPFDDRRVRQAMSYLVPRELINEKIFYGLQKLQNGPFYMEGPQADPKLGQWPYDPAKARALLKEAGFADTKGNGILARNGKPFEFSLRLPAGAASSQKIAEVLQDELAKVGVRMKIEPYEWSVYIEKLDQRDFDACMLAWTAAIDDDPRQIWYSRSYLDRGSNHIGYENPEVDRLILAADEDFDPTTRNEKFRRIHDLIYEDQPYTFLFTGPSLLAQSRRLRNVNTSRIGLDFREWWIPRALQGP